jgi:glycerol kinase
MVETTALGAAMLAGLGCGFWTDVAALSAAWSEERRFLPQLAAEKRRQLLDAWHRAVLKA